MSSSARLSYLIKFKFLQYVQYDSSWVNKKMSVLEAFNICDEKVLQLLDLVIKSRV